MPPTSGPDPLLIALGIVAGTLLIFVLIRIAFLAVNPKPQRVVFEDLPFPIVDFPEAEPGPEIVEIVALTEVPPAKEPKPKAPRKKSTAKRPKKLAAKPRVKKAKQPKRG